MIVCVCNNISERQIRRAVDNGITTMPQLRSELGVGTCCGKCHSCAKTVLREYVEENGARESQSMMFSAAIAA